MGKMSAKFTHLHTHSHYSLLQALPKVPELVGAAKAAGMEALALTDSGNLYGAIEFYKECRETGIKPIIGVDAYVAPRTRFDKEPKLDNRTTRLVLLAKDLRGYHNLLKLVTSSHLEGFYYRPRVDRELMGRHREGVAALIPHIASDVSRALRSGDSAKAQGLIGAYREIYGDDLYLEITHHPELDGEPGLSRAIIDLSKTTGIPLIAAYDVYYLRPEDRRARDTMVEIGLGGDREMTGFGDQGLDFSFITGEQANECFKQLPQALANTEKLANEINLTLDLGRWVFPSIAIPPGSTHDEELRTLVLKGVKRRGMQESKELTDRIEYELGIIKGKGYAPYFLVVADLLSYAHEHDILTTIRGSVAGSMVTYLAGITNVNPFEYKLPFERFLNPERPSAPDIDMDYADDRRDEMIEYAKRRYGETQVAQIGTFGTMMARAAVRDVARALKHPYAMGDRIAKRIPMGSQGFPMTINRALELDEELRGMYKKDGQVREIIDLAKRIEGCARHISVHAAGVVMAPSLLSDYTPLQLDPKGGKMITQYDMYAVEDAGLLKFDFLGIRNLSILAASVKIVRKRRGIDVDIENVPLDDQKTFEMLARGETMGLFQLGGSGMTRYLKELRPSSIHDINAMVALYRPGPMESIPEYIARKHNPSRVAYLDPRMKEILSQSHGVITYQDDVLLVAVRIAGYSWLEADKLRKAMGKKIPAEMEAQKEKFIDGCMKHGGLDKARAEKIWKLIEPFAAYGFNKAHAASYGRVAYQTAYMKANFPVEYMAAVLTADSGDIDKISEIISECKRMGLPVFPPDVNQSFGDFTAVTVENGKDGIRFGLHSIKNFGEGIADAVISERTVNGLFVSLSQFLRRIQHRNLNKKSLESLIKCGALEAFGERGALLANLDSLLQFSKESGADKAQDSLFGLFGQSGLSGMEAAPEVRLSESSSATMEERLAWEKELLGLYVSGHPLEKHAAKLAGRSKTIEELKADLKEGMTGVAAGIVSNFKEIYTKNGDRMVFLKLSDFSGGIEVVLFPRVFSQYGKLIAVDKCVAIKGRLSTRNGETSLVAEAVKEL